MAKKPRKPRTKRARVSDDADSSLDIARPDDEVSVNVVEETGKVTCKRGKLSCDHSIRGSTDDLPPKEKTNCVGCPSKARWLCLHCRVPLCAKGNDHMTAHFEETQHGLYVNLSNGRVLCQTCEEEVEMASNDTPMEGVQEDCAPSVSAPPAVAILHPKAKKHSSASTRGSPVESYALDSRAIMAAIEDEKDDVKPKGLCGLYNMGNTCYANSALQALNNCPPFSDYFRRKTNLRPYTSSHQQPLVSHAFAQLVQNMWGNDRITAIHPANLLYQIRGKCPQFQGYAQQDSQEFIRCLLELLHRELARPVYAHEEAAATAWQRRRQEAADVSSTRSRRLSSSDSTENNGDSGWSSDGDSGLTTEAEIDWKARRHRSIVSDVFDGTMESAVRCLTCNNVSTDLSLQIATPPVSVASDESDPDEEMWSSSSLYSGWGLYRWLSSFSSWFVAPSVSLEECFAAFFTPDRLIGDDMYSCEKCSKLRNGVKSYRITKLPEVLCVHLKRFHHDHMNASKVSTRVSFPISGLDLSRWSTGEAGESEYELCALVCHEGASVDSGHYVAVARNEIDDNWYEFDDHTVTKLDAGYVLTKDAYVLFYQKKQHQGVQKTRDVVRDLISSLSIATNPSMESYYISSEWLERLSTFTEPGPITNFDFLCPHGNILPRRSDHIPQLVTAVPASLWKYLVQRFGGGPAVAQLHYCAVCEKRRQSLVEKRMREHDLFRRLEAVLASDMERDINLIYDTHLPRVMLSRSWYNEWEKFTRDPNAEPPGQIDNSSLLAKMPDGNLRLRPRTGALAVPRELFLFFHEIYGGGPEVWQVEGPQPEEAEKAEILRKADRAIAAARERVRTENERPVQSETTTDGESQA